MPHEPRPLQKHTEKGHTSCLISCPRGAGPVARSDRCKRHAQTARTRRQAMAVHARGAFPRGRTPGAAREPRRRPVPSFYPSAKRSVTEAKKRGVLYPVKIQYSLLNYGTLGIKSTRPATLLLYSRDGKRRPTARRRRGPQLSSRSGREPEFGLSTSASPQGGPEREHVGRERT